MTTSTINLSLHEGTSQRKKTLTSQRPHAALLAYLPQIKLWENYGKYINF